MNKAEAYKTFINKHLKFLTSTEFDNKVLKSHIRDFFNIKHNKKYGLPSLSDICGELVNYQIKYHVGKEKLIDQINNSPIYSYISENKRNIFLSIIDDKYQGGLSEEDIVKLEKMSTIEAATVIQRGVIEKKLAEDNEKLKQEKEEIELEIKKKKEESRLLYSILDDDPMDEPVYDPDIEYVKQWWERFYLKDNPFPGNKDGLSQVDEALYDNVVSKSQPYIDLLNKLKIDPDYLFHTSHLLVGDFGFGKTTFQDYLISYLANHNILPIRITCLKAYPDSNGYHDHFILKLKRELLKRCDSCMLEEMQSMPPEEVVIEISNIICNKYRGIVIFLDDYHKSRKDYDAVYDFLGGLQPIKDELTRNNSNVGFIVSGVPTWEEQMGNNQQLSGFFDSPRIKMPSASVDFIIDIFNRRISAYCYDSQPRSISRAFVEKLFNNTNGLSSYRDYLNSIIDELERNNFSIVNTPIEISEEILRIIKSKYEKDDITGTSINKLLNESKFKKFNQEQIHKCLELIVVIFTQEYIPEGDRVFTDNIYYFNRLKECGLIQKRKTKKYSQGFVWVVSKRLINVGVSVYEAHGYSIPDYFLKIFSHSSVDLISTLKQSDDNSSISRLKKDLIEYKDKLDKSVVDNIADALAHYERFDADPSDRRKTTSAITSIIRSFDSLFNALSALDGSNKFFIKMGMHDLRNKINNHSVGSDLLNDMQDKIALYEKNRDSVSYSVAATTAKGAFEYLVDYVRKTLEDIVSADVNLFRYHHNVVRHNEKDISKFEIIKEDVFSSIGEKHFNYIEQITNHLEIVFRSFLYITSSLCFGKSEYTKHIKDVDSVLYARRNTKGSDLLYHNIFDGFTRPQYRQVFIQNGLIKELIIKELELDWINDTWEKFFDMFVEENISTSHQKKSEYSVLFRDRYIMYCNLSQQLIGAMNIFVSNIVNESTYINYGGSMSVENCGFKVAFAKKNDKSFSNVNAELQDLLKKNEKVCEHAMNESVFNKISQNILGKLEFERYYIEDILDVEYIYNHYGYPLQDFILTLSYLQHVQKELRIETWFGSKIIITKR